MRALFHHPHPEWNGGARAFALAARGLAARGWQVLFACCPDTEPHRRAVAMGLPVHPLESGDGFVAGSSALARALRDQFVEVVFVHGERAHLAAAGATWRAERGVIVRRFGVGEAAVIGRAVRATLRSAPTKLLCSWPEQAAAIPADLGVIGVVTTDLGVVVPAEADATSRARREGPLRRLVCMHGRGARGRSATVLRAVAMLAPRHPELRVALVGPGSDDEELRMHAAALGVNRIVAHLGEAGEPAELFADADLGWVIADGDDGAFGVLDALAAGVPVLVDRGTDAARYVPDAIGGVHLEPGDVAGAAAVVAQLLAHDADRHSMGAAGRARVARIFTEAAMLDGFTRAAAAARERARPRAWGARHPADRG
ncbi:MAG: glycosyltransferase [Gemmatirosa sp.]